MKRKEEQERALTEEKNDLVTEHHIHQISGLLGQMLWQSTVRIQDLQHWGVSLPWFLTFKEPESFLCCAQSDDGFSEGAPIHEFYIQKSNPNTFHINSKLEWFGSVLSSTIYWNLPDNDLNCYLQWILIYTLVYTNAVPGCCPHRIMVVNFLSIWSEQIWIKWLRHPLHVHISYFKSPRIKS